MIQPVQYLSYHMAYKFLIDPFPTNASTDVFPDPFLNCQSPLPTHGPHCQAFVTQSLHITLHPEPPHCTLSIILFETLNLCVTRHVQKGSMILVHIDLCLSPCFLRTY